MKPKQLFLYSKWFACMFAFVLLSCQERAVSPPYFQTSKKDISALFPLYLGNKWAYVDSVGTETELRISTVTSYIEEDGCAWWTLDLDGGLFELSVVNDSVYARSKQKGLLNPFLSYIPPSPTGETQFFVRRIYHEDSIVVHPLAHPFVVPAGTFDSVLVLESNLRPGRYFEYFRPRIGLLGTETYQGTTKLESTHLIYYKLFR